MPNQHLPDFLCSTFPRRRASICRALKRLANMASEIAAKGIRFQAVEPRSSVRDRLRNEGVDGKLGGVNRLTTLAEPIDNLVLNFIKLYLVICVRETMVNQN